MEIGKELASALVKAQASIGAAAKDSTNPFFKSKYADLSSVVDAIKPHLAANGLAYIQKSQEGHEMACIQTVIIHSSGQSYECGWVSVPVSKADAQGYGSAMTYARRYSLSAAFGVTAEDDDGNAAAKAPPKAQKGEKGAPKVTAGQIDAINSLIDEVGADPIKFLDWLRVDAIEDISGVDYNMVIAALEKKRKPA